MAETTKAVAAANALAVKAVKAEVVKSDNRALETAMKDLKSEADIAKLKPAQLDAFVTKESFSFQVAAMRSIVHTVNLGRALKIGKLSMPKGDFRNWAEKQHGFKT